MLIYMYMYINPPNEIHVGDLQSLGDSYMCTSADSTVVWLGKTAQCVCRVQNCRTVYVYIYIHVHVPGLGARFMTLSRSVSRSALFLLRPLFPPPLPPPPSDSELEPSLEELPLLLLLLEPLTELHVHVQYMLER